MCTRIYKATTAQCTNSKEHLYFMITKCWCLLTLYVENVYVLFWLSWFMQYYYWTYMKVYILWHYLCLWLLLYTVCLFTKWEREEALLHLNGRCELRGINQFWLSISKNWVEVSLVYSRSFEYVSRNGSAVCTTTQFGDDDGFFYGDNYDSGVSHKFVFFK